jgi:hypothetical protein
MPEGARESTIVANIIRYLRALPDAWARKVHGGPYGTVGEPDIDACVAGRTVKIEVKRPGTERTLTAMQARALEQWKRAGAVAFVATSVEQVEQKLTDEGLI